MSRTIALTAMALLVGLAGCSSDKRLKTTPVSGELLVDGKPGDGVVVLFHPVGGGLDDKSPRPSGTVDKDGKFKVSTYVEGDGAPPGEYALTFDWREKPKGITMGGSDLKDLFFGKYSDKTKSAHKVTVKAGEPNVIPKIELKK